MRFEWDAAKAAANERKHGVKFLAARLVFFDPALSLRPDRDADGEERWLAVGTIGADMVIVVVHTGRSSAGEEVIRIISARKATGMSVVSMNAAIGPLTAEEQEAIDRLAAIRDEDIDYSDIPEVTDFTGFRRGLFHLPRGEAASGETVTVRLDADTLGWFVEHADGPAGVEAAIAAVLERHVQAARATA